MDRLGAVILGAVERHQQAAVQDPVRGQLPARLQGPNEVDKHWCQMRRRDRIEQVADLLGAGNLVDAKQRTGVVASVRLLHPPLIIQERRTLQEEHREGTQPSVSHRVALVVAALAPIRQAAERRADHADEHRRRDGGPQRGRGRLEDHRTLQ
jgi:hypothetical protein